MSKDRRTEEKERLWNEVLGKKRAYESTDASEQITLSIDGNEQSQNLNILKQYDALQTAQTDPNYKETKEKLGKTVVLINDAMKNMIASYTDQDFINLSADMATLNAVLKKDGLTSDGMFEVGHKGDE